MITKEEEYVIEIIRNTTNIGKRKVTTLDLIYFLIEEIDEPEINPRPHRYRIKSYQNKNRLEFDRIFYTGDTDPYDIHDGTLIIINEIPINLGYKYFSEQSEVCKKESAKLLGYKKPS